MFEQDAPGPEAAEQEAEPEYIADEETLWAKVEEYRKSGLDARQPEEKWWQLCWRYYDGDQWITWRQNSIQNVNTQDKPKLVINKIMATVQTRRAHLLKNRPIGICVPETPDEEDRNAARVGSDVIESYHHSLDLEQKDADTSLELEVTGNAFQKVYWNPLGGDVRDYERIATDPESGAPVMSEPKPRVDPATGMPVLDETGQPAMEEPEPVFETVSGPVGEVVVEVVGPEELLIDPNARRLEDANWVIHRTLKPKGYLKQLYGDKAEELRPVDTSSLDGSALLEAWKSYNGGRDANDMVETLELWMKPDGEEYQKGLYAVFADKKLMAGSETPKGHAHIPFVKFSEIERKGVWSHSVIRHLLDVQKTLNLTISQQEYNRRMLRPRLAAPHEAGIDDAEWSNDDATIPRFTAGFEPRYISPDALPAHHIEEREYLDASFDDIGGSQDILRGQASEGARSGRMVAYLGEYAGTVLGLVAQNFARGIQKRNNMILSLVKQNCNEERIAKRVGRNRRVEVFHWQASDLDGCGDYVVETQSAIPMTQAEKRDMIMNLMDKGHLPPDKGLEWLGLPQDMDEDWAERQLDRDNATQENFAFGKITEDQVRETGQTMEQDAAMSGAPPQIDPMTGQPQPVATPEALLETLGLMPRDFENHEEHLKVLNRWRKSRAYKLLPKAAQVLADVHGEKHMEYLAQQMAPPPGADGSAEGGPPTEGALGGDPLFPGGGVGGESSQENAQGLPPVPSVAGPHPGVQ